MANPIRMRAISGLKEGDSFMYEREFSQEETWAFGDLTRDYNPVHYDPRWAKMKDFKGPICHGLLVGSMITEFGGQVGWLATGMNFKFLKPVYFGDTIQCSIRITKMEENGRAEARAIFANQDNEEVCHADLTGFLPMSREQDLLRQMVNEGDLTNRLNSKKYQDKGTIYAAE